MLRLFLQPELTACLQFKKKNTGLLGTEAGLVCMVLPVVCGRSKFPTLTSCFYEVLTRAPAHFHTSCHSGEL